jgi:hypothetical protein
MPVSLRFLLYGALNLPGAEAETSGDGGLRRSRTSNPVGPDLEQIRSGGTGNLESSAASNSVREQARTQARNSQISQPALKRRLVCPRQLVLGGGLAALTFAAAYWTIPVLSVPIGEFGELCPERPACSSAVAANAG